MEWSKYLGIPFKSHGDTGDGVDCWGLVRHVLAAEKGWQLPSYGEGYARASDQRAVTECIRAGLISGWDRVDGPEEFALVVFRMAGRPWHVGLCVSPTQFLHAPSGETSCVERLSSPCWINRIEGFYVRR